MKYSYNPPAVVKRIFKDFYWNSSINKILLTFDDGPEIETTERILDTLNLYGTKALFFCRGDNIKNNPSLIDLLISEGHEIGNHTFNHKRIDKLNPAKLNNEIDSVNLILKKQHNYLVKYFRPPYGKFSFLSARMLREKGLKNVMWSLLTQDYKNDLNLVKFGIKNYLQKDSIAVFHDSFKSKEIITRALDFFFEEINKKGFKTGTPSECLK